MRIAEVELHEFTYHLEDVGTYRGRQTYVEGNVAEPPGFVLTVRTETGLEGQYRGFVFVPPVVAQVKMAAGEFLIGRNPLEREGIWQDLWRAFRPTDHLGVGPIDVALWDLAGKHYGESVSSLLGGYRHRIPACASTYMGTRGDGGLDTPAAYAAFAEECLDAGYAAFKVHPFGVPGPDAEVVHAVGEAVGDEMDLIFDPANEYRTYAEALRVGRACDEHDYLWYEDPLVDAGDSFHTSRRLARRLDTPLLGLEHARIGHYGAANVLSRDVYEFVGATTHADAGITGVMKLATLAESFGVDLELNLGGPSHLHCASAIRNNNFFQRGLLHPEIEWMTEQGFAQVVETVEDDGTVAVPEGPGLGVAIDWDFVEERLTDHTVIDTEGASYLS